MADLSADVQELLGLLDTHRVEYLICGGHAVAFHGTIRMTLDVTELEALHGSTPGA